MADFYPRDAMLCHAKARRAGLSMPATAQLSYLFIFEFLFHVGIRLATFNLSTKFEVSVSYSFKNVKGCAKCRKWVGLGVIRGQS